MERRSSPRVLVSVLALFALSVFLLIRHGSETDAGRSEPLVVPASTASEAEPLEQPASPPASAPVPSSSHPPSAEDGDGRRRWGFGPPNLRSESRKRNIAVTVVATKPRILPPGGSDPAAGFWFLLEERDQATPRHQRTDDLGRTVFHLRPGARFRITLSQAPPEYENWSVESVADADKVIDCHLEVSRCVYCVHFPVYSDDPSTPIKGVVSRIHESAISGGTPATQTKPGQELCVFLQPGSIAAIEVTQGQRLVIVSVQLPEVPEDRAGVIDHPLPPVTLPPVNLVGRVLDSEGRPLALAYVKATVFWQVPATGRTSFKSLSLETDDSGSFAFGLAGAEGLLKVSHRDYRHYEGPLASGDVMLTPLPKPIDVLVHLPASAAGHCTLSSGDRDGESRHRSGFHDGDGTVRFERQFRKFPSLVVFRGLGLAQVFEPPFATDPDDLVHVLPTARGAPLSVQVEGGPEPASNRPRFVFLRLVEESLDFTIATAEIRSGKAEFEDLPTTHALKAVTGDVECPVTFPVTVMKLP